MIFFEVAIALAWVVLAFVALGEFSLREFSHSAMERAASSPLRKARQSQIFQRHEDMERALTECRMVLLAALVLAIGLLGRDWIDGIPGPANLRPLIFTASLLLALLVTTVWIPWTVARLWSEPFLLATWPIWLGVEMLFAPFRGAAGTFDALFHRMAGRERMTGEDDSLEDEILTMVAEGHHEGVIEEEARDMIEGVIDLADSLVSSIMTPRTDVIMLNQAADWADIARTVVESGHSRLPVYNGVRDDVVGIVHVKDLLPVLIQAPNAESPKLEQFLRPAFFVPETKNLHALLHDFQQQRQHMALVLDEYGGVSGLVTIEDVLEEIVGEIVDEHDDALQDNMVALGDGAYEMQGREHVDEINERLAVEIPEDDDYETVAGFLFKKLGYVPVVGECVELPTCHITVVEASRRAVQRVRVRVLGAPGDQYPTDESRFNGEPHVANQVSLAEERLA